MAKVFGYSRSSFYHIIYYKPKENVRKKNVYRHILSIYDSSHGTYGSPRITYALREEGINITRRTVANYMRQLNIHSITYKKFRYKKTCFKDYAYLMLKNHKKDADVTDINQVWTQDVTYIKLNDGTFGYLASIMDYYSRKVIAWEMGKNMSADLIMRVLRRAYDIRHPHAGLILHSDKGSQYRCDQYKEFAYHHRAVCSYTRIVFSCADNASQESFHASFKKECLYQMRPMSFDDANKLIFRYIDGFYNVTRRHSSLGYKSPMQFEEELNHNRKKKVEIIE